MAIRNFAMTAPTAAVAHGKHASGTGWALVVVQAAALRLVEAARH